MWITLLGDLLIITLGSSLLPLLLWCWNTMTADVLWLAGLTVRAWVDYLLLFVRAVVVVSRMEIGRRLDLCCSPAALRPSVYISALFRENIGFVAVEYNLHYSSFVSFFS